jgi:hypothetical protein
MGCDHRTESRPVVPVAACRDTDGGARYPQAGTAAPSTGRTPDRLRPALPGGTAGAGPEELTEGCMVSCFHCASAIHVPPDLVGQATRHARERSEIPQGSREPSAQRQHENLTSALGTRAVGALEDLALDVAAMASAPGAHGHIPRLRGPRTRGAARTELTPPDSDLRSRADPTAPGGWAMRSGLAHRSTMGVVPGSPPRIEVAGPSSTTGCGTVHDGWV